MYLGSQNFTLHDVSNANALIRNFHKCKKGVTWKESVQKYEIDLLKNTYYTQKKLDSGTYKSSKFVEFPLSERGKTRWIKSMHVRDRVVQASVCNEVLLPELEKYLIYNNGASLPGKGIDFTLSELYKDLKHFYYTNGNKGYIVLADFTKFFDNIPHNQLKKDLTRDLDDQPLIDLIEYLITLFEIDLSILPEDMQKEFKEGVFNNLKYSAYLHQNHKHSYRHSNNMLQKSVGVGSQISQIAGVYYPTKIDNYFTIVKGYQGYGRYMDDTYILVKTLEEAEEVLRDLHRLAAELGIHINEKKTQVVRIDSWFTFLKIRHKVQDNGHIIRITDKKNTVRERRKLKSLKNLLDNNVITFADVNCSYQSFKGRLRRYNNYYTIRNMDTLFDKLFIEDWHYDMIA